MLFSGAWGKMNHEKNLKQKISWHCPFKYKDTFQRNKTKSDLSFTWVLNLSWVAGSRCSKPVSWMLMANWAPSISNSPLERRKLIYRYTCYTAQNFLSECVKKLAWKFVIKLLKLKLEQRWEYTCTSPLQSPCRLCCTGRTGTGIWWLSSPSPFHLDKRHSILETY